MSALIGPQFPSTPGERTVWRDWLLEHNYPVPWPIREKPAQVLGADLAARAAKACSTLASATAVLAGIEQQRAQAQADVDASREALEQIGINSLSELATIDYQRKYPVCADPRCERVCSSWWVVHENSGWRCDDHQLPAPSPSTASPVPAPAPAPAPEEIPF